MILAQKVFFITPPFTQLNTPYPATAYLKGYLNTQGMASAQADLGIDVILQLFSAAGLRKLFATVARQTISLSENAQRIVALQHDYIRTIDYVVQFLQDKNPTLAHVICEGQYLPEASRFNEVDDLEWAFGAMGTRDKARHLATLYLEDISDLIVEAVDPHFGFSRYAERLARSASSFDELYAAIQSEGTFIDGLLHQVLHAKMQEVQPTLVALSVPFPGNLYSAFKCGQYIKQHFPGVKIVLGGGFANTELRSLTDARVFEFIDFITLDDGEAPLVHLLEYLDGKRNVQDLKRTFLIENNAVTYYNGSAARDVAQKDVGTPDYTGLPLDKYLSVIEIANPMHRLWSDGRWNKLTLAHGCYWGKCTFCDISLDYIKRYEPSTAALLCDRIEELVAQTGQNGFHFVDEAAPPALMRDLALEIIRRGLTVVWWTNIRFEKSFTRDLCLLLKESGCIAVSGGLEVASDRLLSLIEKGVTVEQVARVAHYFTEAGIMVHAYLMYGFPTQTAQETIDALDVVRQLFMNGVVQSGYWHQFAMTAHSPVGIDPAAFKVKIENAAAGAFANNDLVHTDDEGAEHEMYSEGLKKSLFNYMHGVGFDYPLQKWFDMKVPRTTVAPRYIETVIGNEPFVAVKPNARLVWLGNMPVQHKQAKTKKGQALTELVFMGRRSQFSIATGEAMAANLTRLLAMIQAREAAIHTYAQIKDWWENETGQLFELVWNAKEISTLRENGLLVL